MKSIRNLVGLMLLSCFLFSANVFAQGGNTISGYIFGVQRQGLEGITVELMDDLNRTLFRVRTDSTGRYFFSRMSAGTYKVRVMPLGTNYEEQEGRVQIQNFLGSDPSGNAISRGFANEQKDFYLRLDNRKQGPLTSETVYVQEVPKNAKQLYDEAIPLLVSKNKNEGYKKLIAAIEEFPDYYMAIERLGLEYINAKHYKAAEILLLRAVDINSRSFKGWYGLAFTYYALEMYDESLKPAKKALSLDGKSIDALIMTGKILRQTKKYKESEEYLTKAKKLTTTPIPDIHWQLALLYGNNLRRYKDAADELETFLKLQPDSEDAEKIKSLIKTFKDKSKGSSSS